MVQLYQKFVLPQLRLLLMSVLFTILTQGVQAQIQGKIIDSSSEPLIGVNIATTNNPTLGTITDIDGNFDIDAVVGDTLVLSYVGYQTQYYPISSQGNINSIVLDEASELLEEVVVIGYGAVDKDDLTGVVTKVGEDDFNKGAISSPERLLNGKVAGIQIATNGEPGGETKIRLRGGTSLDASSDPLIVVDGVPLDSRKFQSSRNQLNFVNALDIESMTVLKDASAAAIYGSRGANGVIIITTKTGEIGKAKFEYAGNVNVSQFSGNTTNLSGQNFRNAISNKAPQEIEFLGDNNTNWMDEVTQTASSTQHNFNISGGVKKSRYLVSFGYLNSKGALKTSAHEKRNITGNFSTKLFNDALTVSYRTKTAWTKDNFASDVLGSALSFDPTRPTRDSSSMYGGYFQWSDPLANNNPLSTLELKENTGDLTRLLNNLTLTYELPFLKGLSITSNTSYDHASGTKREFTDPLEKSEFVRGGKLFNEDLRNYSALIETYGTYSLELDKVNSKLDLTLGHSWQEFDQENRWIEGNGLELDSNEEYQYTTDIRQDSFLVTNRLISFFGRANLNLSEKYLLTASLRRDGSSRFGPANKWGLFPAAAFAWRILEEDFASGLNNVFSDFKIRLSWGVTGNENIDDFLFKTFYSFGTADASYQFGDEYVNTLRGTGVDPNIKWEETTSTNLGFDFGFSNNRINGSLDLYRKKTNDLLFTVATPAFTNLADRVLTNIGEMENSGVELSLNLIMADKSNFGWDIGFNAASNKNRITKLDNSLLQSTLYETGGISGDVGQTIQALKVGESIETFRTYNHKLGADGKPIPDTEDIDGDGLPTNLDIYEDINGDGLINENDLVLGRSALPKLILGLTTNFRFGNFDVNAGMRSHFGNYAYNNVASGSGYFDKLTDRVTNNVDESAFEYNFKTRQLKSDVYIENASFFKLDNITLGYNMPVKKVFSRLRLYATVNNVLVVTGYSGMDPEQPQFNSGIDNELYPISRNYLLGLNASF